jgi:hypothetical protein
MNQWFPRFAVEGCPQACPQNDLLPISRQHGAEADETQAWADCLVPLAAGATLVGMFGKWRE